MEDWTAGELETKLDAGEQIFLKLWKPGCGACKLSSPAIERIEKEYGSEMQFGQINTEEFPEMLEITKTNVLPVFFLFKEKELKGKFIGFKGLKKLQNWISETGV